MAKVNICNVVVLDNPTLFVNPFQFEITFECLEDLTDDLDWKIIYVGSAESEDYDQILDSVLVGPLVAGKHKFVFQANSPDTSKIPVQDIIGVTVVLLTCSYKGREFVRVGYYINNEYTDPEMKENPPPAIDYEKLSRNILSVCPRVTRFRIDWNDEGTEETNSENMPPIYNTETESNQMSGESISDPFKVRENSQSNQLSNGGVNNQSTVNKASFARPASIEAPASNGTPNGVSASEESMDM